MQLRLRFVMLILAVLQNRLNKKGRNKVENVYLLSGDDTFEKEQYIEKLKEQFPNKQKGLQVVVLDKDSLHLLEQELSTYSFFMEPKLILVKVPKKAADEDAEKGSKKDWFSEDLEDKILHKIENITLVFVEEGTSKGKLYKFISQYGKVMVFDKKKPQEIATWVQKYVQDFGLTIGKAEATYMVDLCGANKLALVNEIKKLIDYVENAQITKQAIDALCSRTSEVIIFDLTDSYGKKNKKATLQYLEDLIEQKEPLQKIFIMIAKHFKSLLLAKVAIEQGKNVAQELSISPYPARKYAEQAKNFSMEELITIFKEFAKLDEDSKVGKIDLKVGLQKMIMAY